MPDNHVIDSDLGYVYEPDYDPVSLGYRQLDVNLRARPTGQHYDPVDLRFPAATPQGIEQLHVRHPWVGSASHRMCVGRIIMADWRNKEVEAFTFGGKAGISVSEICTRCSLCSDVPILALEPTSLGRKHEDLASLLAQRAEGLLARARGLAAKQSPRFEALLISIEPLMLYCAVIEVLEAEFQPASTYPSEEANHFARYLRAEHQHFEETGRWTQSPSLVDLLMACAN
jgi:hypothetical protein